ncbi:MAG: tetratricopeptide repeat protein [Microscillaceae bacterium]|jgi:tetratricopeptide (TPR) repeat protein|nr:tetratricopeptide repeat protein [Microscillaceae bacterium]
MKVFSFLGILICLGLSAIAQTAEDYAETGYKYAYEGNYALALKNYDKAIKTDPRFAKAYYNRAHVKYDLQDYKGVVEDCRRALEINPNLIDAYFNMAVAKYQLKDYESAIGYFDKSLQYKTQDGETYCWRGMAKFKLNRKAEACQDWQTARSLGNSYVNSYLLKYCEEEGGVEPGGKN